MIIEFLSFWLVTVFGLWLVTHIVPGVQARTTRSLWVAALVLGLVNAFIRPLLWVLTLPLTLVTFGLFALVVNALMIKFTAWLVHDFEVKSFGAAIYAAVVMSLLGLVGFIILHGLMLGDLQWTIIGPQPPQSNGIEI